MPRRVWQDDPDLDRLVLLMTKWLRHTDSRCAGRCAGCDADKLKPAQAVLLRELHDLRGAAGPLRPGAGKTLAALLAPTVLESERPLLVLPADQEPQIQAVRVQYAKHWRVAATTIVTYEFLSHPNNLNWVSEFKPDLIVCDEAHKLKNSGSKAAKRIGKYLRDAPKCVFMPMSGSFSGRSILDYGHYVRWALKSRAPVPSDPFERRAWAMALDENVHELDRNFPGPLLRLGPDVAGEDELIKARRIYQSRFTSTRGVVSTLEDIPPCGLHIKATELPLPRSLQDEIRNMRETGCTPWGEDFVCSADLWRHSRTMGGAGLFHRWDPPAPPAWRAARTAWYKFAREQLKGKQYVDSTVHIERAILAGEIDDGGVLAAWRAIEHTFEPNSVPVWRDDTALNYAKAWLKREKGLVWVEARAFGDRLAAETGVPFFTSGGCDERGNLVDFHEGPAIVSMKTCREGHNLQKTQHKNLLLTPPPTGEWCEQILARTHRDGQVQDDVYAEFVLTTRETYHNLARIVRECAWDQDMHGQPKKIIYANRDLGQVEDLLKNEDLELGV